jgi:hypothetical protein
MSSVLRLNQSIRQKHSLSLSLSLSLSVFLSLFSGYLTWDLEVCLNPETQMWLYLMLARTACRSKKCGIGPHFSPLGEAGCNFGLTKTVTKGTKKKTP